MITPMNVNPLLNLIDEIESSPAYYQFTLQNKLNQAVLAHDTTTVMNIAYNNEFDIHGYSQGSITPLMWASQNGFIDIMIIMINLNVDVNFKSFGGFTALTDAVINGHVEAVQLLLSSGADKTVLNNLGQTLVQLAKNNDIIALLEESTVLCQY
jgi:ankyrin repeat protein